MDTHRGDNLLWVIRAREVVALLHILCSLRFSVSANKGNINTHPLKPCFVDLSGTWGILLKSEWSAFSNLLTTPKWCTSIKTMLISSRLNVKDWPWHIYISCHDISQNHGILGNQMLLISAMNHPQCLFFPSFLKQHKTGESWTHFSSWLNKFWDILYPTEKTK